MKHPRASESLTTGEAARLLGCTRQHIVDLCDRGTLRCERRPVHRRVLRVDVETIAHRRKGLAREEQRSLWLNRAIAGHLARDPEAVIARARENLERFEQIHAGTGAERWLRRWRDVLDDGPEAVMQTLTSTAPEAIDLRQNSPFPGVLTEVERREVLDAFARHWKHAAA